MQQESLFLAWLPPIRFGGQVWVGYVLSGDPRKARTAQTGFVRALRSQAIERPGYTQASEVPGPKEIDRAQSTSVSMGRTRQGLLSPSPPQHHPNPRGVGIIGLRKMDRARVPCMGFAAFLTFALICLSILPILAVCHPPEPTLDPNAPNFAPTTATPTAQGCQSRPNLKRSCLVVLPMMGQGWG